MFSIEGRHDGRRILLDVAVFGTFGLPAVRQVTARALIDTGATKSGIAPRIITELGLDPLENRPLMVATELRLVKFYLFRIGLYSNQSDRQLPFVFDESDGFQIGAAHDFEVLLGMDILRQCDFSLTRAGHWHLSCG